MVFNRRIKMKNGRTYTHPGKGNPDNVNYAGPIDPEVGVIGVWDENDEFLGCIVNYACHGTTSPGGISADWIYYLEKTIRGVMGEDAIVVYLQGASGDVAQIDNLRVNTYEVGEKAALKVGQNVGTEVLKVLANAEPTKLCPLGSKVKMLQIPRRRPSKKRVQQAMEIVRGKEDIESADWIFAKELLLLDATIKREPVADVEVQAIQIGAAIFLANPAEFFCQAGLDIKKDSPFSFTYVVGLANGFIGYVPTKEAFDKNGGGYETRLTNYSNLEITAADQIVKSSKELIRKFKPIPASEYSKVKPGTTPELAIQPWSYGTALPELE